MRPSRPTHLSLSLTHIIFFVIQKANGQKEGLRRLGYGFCCCCCCVVQFLVCFVVVVARRHIDKNMVYRYIYRSISLLQHHYYHQSINFMGHMAASLSCQRYS